MRVTLAAVAVVVTVALVIFVVVNVLIIEFEWWSGSRYVLRSTCNRNYEWLNGRRKSEIKDVLDYCKCSEGQKQLLEQWNIVCKVAENDYRACDKPSS